MITCPHCKGTKTKNLSTHPTKPSADKFKCLDCQSEFLRYYGTPYGWKHYEDSECAYGYMTICDVCATGPNVPRYIDLLRIVDRTLPHPHCELCKRPLK